MSQADYDDEAASWHTIDIKDQWSNQFVQNGKSIKIKYIDDLLTNKHLVKSFERV